jgi:hypothetical protein
MNGRADRLNIKLEGGLCVNDNASIITIMLGLLPILAYGRPSSKKPVSI